MTTFSELAPLKLFNEKAEKLLNSRFVKYLNEKGLSANISDNDNQGFKVERYLPDQEAIDAFILTFRFFIQDNEKSSFRSLGKTYEKLLISIELKKKFVEWREALNHYLDQKISMTLNGYNPSNREILDIFIYGELAHSNPKKKTIYDSWKEMWYSYTFLEVWFCSILEHVLRAIRSVAEINKKAIVELEK